jgi:Ribonuclease G/E
MGLSIAVSTRHRVARIALLRGDVLAEYFLWRPAAPDGVGDVYTGRVTAISPAMAGSFVDLGNATGFLPDRGAVTEGQYVTVRVVRAAQGGKGPRLAALTDPPGDRPGLLARGDGPLVELAQRFPAAPVFIDDYAMIASLRPMLEGRMTYHAASFDAVLEDEVAGLAQPAATLPGGAVMHITPTPALTAIDIDSGAATGEIPLALNTAIIPEIARQIVLRNLSGAILIDFSGMKARHRERLAPALTAALASDPLGPRLAGFSHLGFAEIIRPRIRPPLHESLSP